MKVIKKRMFDRNTKQPRANILLGKFLVNTIIKSTYHFNQNKYNI